MRRAVFTCVGTEPMLFGKRIMESKRPDETNEQLEERAWRQRCTIDENGELAVPSFAVQRSLVWAGKWLNEKIKGENKKTYTRRIECGVQPEAAFFPLSNGKKRLKPDDVERLDLDVPSQGQRGGGKRVMRYFPRLKPGWSFTASMLILDDAITESVFRRHLETAGLYDGMGSMRHGTGGPNGRYKIESLRFENVG